MYSCLLYLYFFRLHPLSSRHDDAQQVLNPKQSIAHDLSQVAKKLENEISVPLGVAQEVSDNMLEDVNPMDGADNLPQLQDGEKFECRNEAFTIFQYCHQIKLESCVKI